MATGHKRRFRPGIYVFTDAEIVDFAAPPSVFSVAQRFGPGARCVPHRRYDAAGAGAVWRVHLF
jgi:hypothetical protein